MQQNKYLLIILLLLSACVKEPIAPPKVTGNGDRPLMSILQNNYNFSMFYSALVRTGLDKTLEGEGPFTVLVPDNNAFAVSGINTDSLAKMDTATLGNLLRYHIIPANVSYSTIPQAINTPYTTLAQLPVYFSEPIPGPVQFQGTGAIVHINGIAVAKTDILASNGLIHALSSVLYYPAASVQQVLEKTPKYSYFVQGLKAFGMWDKLAHPDSVYTIMAPSNDQFDQWGVTGSDLDPVNYKTRMLTPYVLKAQRIFTTDLRDAPLDRGVVGIVTPEYIIALDCYNVTYSLYSFDYKKITDLNWVPPYYGNPNVYGPGATFIDGNHQAGNGVVNGLNSLVMMPDSARVTP
jgi:uncharacterized surface protein with fasciclin (FAS1) repeats